MKILSTILLSALKKVRDGHFSSLTPEEHQAFSSYSVDAQVQSAALDSKRTKEEAAARSAFSERDLKIHDHMFVLWLKMTGFESDGGFYDSFVVGDASAKFNIPREEPRRIYDAIESAISSKYG